MDVLVGKNLFYNERNDVSKITSVNGSQKEDSTFDYTYDEHGNWITRIQYSGKETTTTHRVIEYYTYE